MKIIKYFNVKIGFPIRFPSLDNSFVDRKEFYYKYYWTISYLLQNVTTVKPAPAPLKLLKVEQNCSLQYLPKNARTIRDGNVSFLISFRSDCMIARYIVDCCCLAKLESVFNL